MSQYKTATVIPFFTAWLACLADTFECYFLCTPENESTRFEIYQKLYPELYDDESRSTLLAHLRLRFFHDASITPTPRISIPFLTATFSQPELIYIDCGAYDGDTVDEFIVNSKQNFRHIFALEPDIDNRKRMMIRFQSYSSDLQNKITILPVAIWRDSGDIGFNSSGDMSSLVDNNSSKKIRALSLDELLCNTSDPIHIKLDVEGAELATLSGAKELMNRCKPTWAISVYHKPDDLANAYLYLAESGHQYNFALRCHGGDGSDLILYAW